MPVLLSYEQRPEARELFSSRDDAEEHDVEPASGAHLRGPHDLELDHMVAALQRVAELHRPHPAGVAAPVGIVEPRGDGLAAVDAVAKVRRRLAEVEHEAQPRAGKRDLQLRAEARRHKHHIRPRQGVRAAEAPLLAGAERERVEQRRVFPVFRIDRGGQRALRRAVLRKGGQPVENFRGVKAAAVMEPPMQPMVMLPRRSASSVRR